MAERFKTAFFAYPGEPADLTATITAAAEGIKKSSLKLRLEIWPQLEVFGSHIPEKVRLSIDDADVLVCDITRPNMNVYYELGFALGRGKAIAPVVNAAFANAIAEIRKDGIFDNIGYKTYENSEQLRRILSDLPDSNLVELYGKHTKENSRT